MRIKFLFGSGYLAGQVVPRGYSAGPGQIVPRDYPAGSGRIAIRHKIFNGLYDVGIDVVHCISS